MADPLSAARVLGWDVRLDLLQDAQRQAADARRGDPEAVRTLDWDNQLTAAYEAFGEINPKGLDFWQAWASRDADPTPHQALLVAAWRTKVADVTDTAEGITAEAGGDFDRAADDWDGAVEDVLGEADEARYDDDHGY